MNIGFWIGIVLQLLPIFKLIANGLGVDVPDIDLQGVDLGMAGSSGLGALLLARSPKAVPVPALRLELAKKT